MFRSPRFAGAISSRPVRFIRTHFKLIWILALPILLGFAIWQERTTLSNGLSALQSADRSWIAGGVALQLALLLGPPVSFRRILRRLGYRISMPALVGMHLQRITIGTLAPLGGPASAVTFVRALDLHRVATADALTLLAMRSIATQTAFITMSIVVISLRDPLAGAISAAVVASAVLFVAMMHRRGNAVTVAPLLARIPGTAGTRLREAITRYQRHELRPSDLVQPASIAILNRVGGLVLLAFAVEALGADATPSMIALVALAEVLAKITVPLFHGLGAIEVATAIALERSGVPPATAIGAALLWRIFECWFPLAVALSVQGGSLLARRTNLNTRLSMPSRWVRPALDPAPVPVPVPITSPLPDCHGQ